jgi:hypothetical protein
MCHKKLYVDESTNLSEKELERSKEEPDNNKSRFL